MYTCTHTVVLVCSKNVHSTSFQCTRVTLYNLRQLACTLKKCCSFPSCAQLSGSGVTTFSSCVFSKWDAQKTVKGCYQHTAPSSYTTVWCSADHSVTVVVANVLLYRALQPFWCTRPLEGESAICVLMCTSLVLVCGRLVLPNQNTHPSTQKDARRLYVKHLSV